MENLDIKEIIKDALGNTLDGMKDNAADLFRETIVPAVIETCRDFVSNLKTEAADSSSLWVKIRNLIIAIGVGILGGTIAGIFCTVADQLDEEKENV